MAGSNVPIDEGIGIATAPFEIWFRKPKLDASRREVGLGSGILPEWQCILVGNTAASHFFFRRSYPHQLALHLMAVATTILRQTEDLQLLVRWPCERSTV